MKKERCTNCYYAGREKCFMYDKKYEEIEKCNEYLIDPYQCGGPKERCQNCHFYITNQCLGDT